jgi:two-component system response regulator (stage 0 sporulation protein F)
MQNLNVLIIEADKYMKETLCEVLDSEGYNVDFALNALDAINKVKQNKRKYPVLVLDHNLGHMQGINGIDIYEIAKELNPEVKAVMISAYGKNKSTKEKALSKGINTFIDKPFLITDLIDAVDDLARNNYIGPVH